MEDHSFTPEQISLVYSSLQDELSREIFISRLNYLFTKNDKFLHHIDDTCFHKDRHFESFHDLLENPYLCDHRIIIFGSGKYGKLFVKLANEAGIKVEEIWDSSESQQGENINGIVVKHPVHFNETAKFTGKIVVASIIYSYEIYEKLVSFGYSHNQIVMPLPYNEIYFGEKFFTAQKNEYYLDCGAYNGNTIKRFLKWCGNNYKKIYAVEPNKNMYGKLKANLTDLHNIEFVQKGLLASSGTAKLLYYSPDSMITKISDCGQESIKAITIDEVCDENIITTIKMDIEGSETNALRGAVKIISSCKPKLAISVYHKPEDIISVPLLLKECCPSYVFWIRHYSNHTIQNAFVDTVLYAISN